MKDKEEILKCVEYSSNNFEKSLLWLLKYAEDSSLRLNQPVVVDLIENEIPNGNQIIPFLGEDLGEIVKDFFGEECSQCEIKIHNSNRRGNLLATHIFLHKLHYDMESFCKNKYELEYIDSILSYFTIINNRISNILLDYAFEEKENPSWNEHYYPNLMIQEYASILRNDVFLKREFDGLGLESDNYKWIIDILTDLEFEFFSQGIEFIKIQTILLTIIETPFYNQNVKKIAKEMMNLFKELLVDSRIMQIYIEPNLEFSDQEEGFGRSSKFEIFFILENSDRYCLRFDFPHKGEAYIHYNMHEPNHDTGLPLLYDKKKGLVELCESDENFNRIFFEYQNLIWFRWNFISKLDSLKLKKENNLQIKKIFREQCHYKVIGDNIPIDDVRLFLREFSIAIYKMKMERSSYKRLSEVDNINEILQKVYFQHFLIENLSIYKRLEEQGVLGDDSVEHYKRKIRDHIIKVVTLEQNSYMWESPDNISEMTFEEIVETIICNIVSSNM